MNQTPMEKFIEIVDKMSEENDEIEIIQLKKEAHLVGLNNIDDLVKEAIEQGLVLDVGDGKIQKIAKRMFW